MRPQAEGYAPYVPAIYWDRVSVTLGASLLQFVAAIEEFEGSKHDEISDLLKRAQEYAQARRKETQERYEAFRLGNPEQWQRCHAGLEPWPDEDATTFQGRCTCNDTYACLHEREKEMTTQEWEEKYGAAVRLGPPWFVCRCDYVPPPCPVPGHPHG